MVLIKINVNFLSILFFFKARPCILTAPCRNGATCTNDNLGGYSCTCASGYTGINCQYGKLQVFSFE